MGNAEALGPRADPPKCPRLFHPPPQRELQFLGSRGHVGQAKSQGK